MAVVAIKFAVFTNVMVIMIIAAPVIKPLSRLVQFAAGKRLSIKTALMVPFALTAMKNLWIFAHYADKKA